MFDANSFDGAGVLHRIHNFASRYVEPRPIDIWYPPEYETNSTARFPVLYMHDGQHLFMPGASLVGIDWGIDEAVMRLLGKKEIPGVIVVGVWNTSRRRREYMPQKALESSTSPQAETIRTRFLQENNGAPFSDDYLKFLVEELKPFIDNSYRTIPDRDHTFIMGSSMGGLISLYALTQYPDIFGGAGCLSSHWVIGEEVLVDALGSALPKPGSHKIYFDYGTQGLDSAYEPYQQRMDTIMKATGYHQGEDWITRKFMGDDHNEIAWRNRVNIPLQFLLTGLPH